MGRCDPSLLKDLKNELADIAKLPGLKEKSPGTFYWKQIPFLHFHVKDEDRWADVKISKKEWGKIVPIPFEPSKAARTVFLKEVKKRHTLLTEGA